MTRSRKPARNAGRLGLAPTHEAVRPYSSTAVDEAVGLAAEHGLLTDDWQAGVLRGGLGERPDGTWAHRTVGLIVPRQNGKGGVVEARELAGLFLFRERLILHSAHEFKTSSEAFLRMKALLENYDGLRRRVRKVREAAGEQGIEMMDGARLRYVARSTGSGRGFTAPVNVLDEAQFLTPPQAAALVPTMSAMTNPQLWLTGTVPESAGTVLASLREQALAGAASTAWFEWSPPLDWRPTPKARPATAGDRQMWQRVNPAMGIRIQLEAVESERAVLDDAEFARERLGIWPPEHAAAWRVITEADWTAAHRPGSRIEGALALSADLTPDRRWGSVAVAGRSPGGRRHVEVTDHHSGTGWVVPRLMELIGKYTPCAVVIDAAGPAGSLVAPLRAEMDREGVRGTELLLTSARDATAAAAMFYDGLSGEDAAGRDISHLAQPELAAAVAGAAKRPLGDAWAWARVSESVDISPLIAASNALWGFGMRGHVTGTPDPWFAWI